MVHCLWFSVYVYGTQVRLWPAIVSGLCGVSEWQRSATDYAGRWYGRLPATAAHRRQNAKLSHLTADRQRPCNSIRDEKLIRENHGFGVFRNLKYLESPKCKGFFMWCAIYNTSRI